MEFSNYQTAIFDAVESTDNNLVVQALAGSGKSTTAVEIGKRLKSRNNMFVAFNKLIADDLKKKLPTNVQAKTLNAYGWGICLRNHKGAIKLEQYKTDGIMTSIVPGKEIRFVGGFVRQMVSLLKAYCVFDVDHFDMEELASRQGLEVPPKFDWSWIKDVYKISIDMTYTMDFDDQIFMPLYHDLPIPQLDNMIIDELQDLNLVQIELVLRSANRFMGVGDENQAIYGFRGACPEAMKTFEDRTNATLLPLSICYRCPIKVIEAAKEIVPAIEWAPSAASGVVDSIKMADFDRRVQTDDYVLCRTTAPLVSNCLRFIRDGRQATVRGRDIGKQLDSLIMKISFGNDSKNIISFLEDLTSYNSKEMARLEAIGRDMEMQALEDRVATLNALSEGCDRVSDMRKRITDIFKDETSGIVFCTVHKSKGLEAKRVFILHPELMPHPAAKVAWAKQQEKNLKYVAITRAMAELYWVK